MEKRRMQYLVAERPLIGLATGDQRSAGGLGLSLKHPPAVRELTPGIVQDGNGDHLTGSAVQGRAVSELVETVIEAGQVTQLGSSLLAQLLEPMGERSLAGRGHLGKPALRKTLEISVGRS
jgi:hypothetical protein